jgi:Flp pilus assembly protein TadG
MLIRGSIRGVATLEFALVAPVAAALALGSVDIARAYVVWAQTCCAASAIAEAAEAAMSAVYAEIPGLSLGNGTSTTASTFQVTLSGVVYSPTCATSSDCAAQTPYTAWSSYLAQTGVSLTTQPLRACGALASVTSFPDDDTQLTKMVTWSAAAGSGKIPLAPQVVADVRATYVPIFSLFLGTIVFWSSAATPAPLGYTNQTVGFNTTAPTGNVQSCTVP